MNENIDRNKINEYIKEIEDIYSYINRHTDQLNIFTVKYKLRLIYLINDLDKVLNELRDLKWCFDNEDEVI
ncbi:MAG: hypothetical protein QXH07_02085 [Thermoplasmata archaeon]